MDEILKTMERMKQVMDIINEINEPELMLSLINTAVDMWCHDKNYSPKEIYQRLYTSAAIINGFVEEV